MLRRVLNKGTITGVIAGTVMFLAVTFTSGTNAAENEKYAINVDISGSIFSRNINANLRDIANPNIFRNDFKPIVHKEVLKDSRIAMNNKEHRKYSDIVIAAVNAPTIGDFEENHVRTVFGYNVDSETDENSLTKKTKGNPVLDGLACFLNIVFFNTRESIFDRTMTL